MLLGEDFLDLADTSNYDKDSDGNDTQNRRLLTIVFNTFVWFQIFNEINARKVNGEWNVVEGFFDNSWFSAILLLTAILQFLIVQFGGELSSTMPLNAKQWAFCVIVGAVSFPVGQLVLWFPVDLTYG